MILTTDAADVEPGDGLRNGRRKEVQTGDMLPLEDGERSVSDEGIRVNLHKLQGVFVTVNTLMYLWP